MPALSVNSSSLSVLVNGVQNAIWNDGVNWHGVLSSGAGPFIRIPGCHATAWDPSRPAILYTAVSLWIGLASRPAKSVAGHLCRYCICWYRVSTICLYLLELASSLRLANTYQVTTMPALSVNSSSLSVLVNGVQNAIWIDGVNWHGVLSSGAGPFIRIPGCHATAWDPSRPAILYTAVCLWIGLASWPANSVAGHLCRYCICWYRVSSICWNWHHDHHWHWPGRRHVTVSMCMYV
jgi:hypothetical protein